VSKVFSSKYLRWFVTIVLAGLLYYYVPATVSLFQAKAFVKDKPEFWQVPQTLALDRADAADGKKLSYFGLSLSTPWQDTKVLRQNERVVLLEFHNTRSMFFFATNEGYNSTRIVRENDKNGSVEATFGVEAMKSNFDLKRAVLNTSPAGLSFSLRRDQMIRQSIFLILKSADVSSRRTGIFEFQMGKVRGFQYGDPATSDAVVLDVFDQHDRLHKIIVATVKNAPTRLTQSEVNTILLSLDSDGSDPAKSMPDKSIASK
jgi:hypothetical protein